MICNSAPLILLSRTRQLSLLKDIFGKITIPQAVKEEVANEKEGSDLIIEAINQKWIIIDNPKEELPIGLDKGENSAISLAKEKNEFIIIDDSQAVKVARSLQIPYYRTTSLLFLAIKKGIITKKQARAILAHFLKEGYYLAPYYYAEILEQLM